MLVIRTIISAEMLKLATHMNDVIRALYHNYFNYRSKMKIVQLKLYKLLLVPGEKGIKTLPSS